MVKTKRLSDLYVIGQAITVTDEDESIDVWVQKLSPIQHERALRAANAARVPISALKNLPIDHMDVQVYVGDLADQLEELDIVEMLIARDEAKIRPAKEDEVGEEEEWAKDGYLQGLRDAWEGDDLVDGLMDEFAMDPEAVEPLRVFNELQRFNDAVEKKIEGEVRHIRSEYEEMDPDVRKKKAVHRMIDHNGDILWMSEYRIWEVYLSVRISEEDKRTLYFEDIDEVKSLAVPVFQQLITTYQELVVSPMEGKD